MPEPADLLLQLYGGDAIEGTAIGTSPGPSDDTTFAIVEVKGLEQPIIVPLGRLLDLG